jgi:hypothetical protein
LDSEADEGVDKFSGASGDFPLSELAAIFQDAFATVCEETSIALLNPNEAISLSGVISSEDVGPARTRSGWSRLSILGSRMHKSK